MDASLELSKFSSKKRWKDGWSALWERSSVIPPSQPTASCSKRRQIMFVQLKKNRESTQSCFHYGSVFCFCVHCCLLNDTDIADSRDEEREEKLGNVNKAAISTVKDTKSFSIFILTPKELLHCNGWTKLNAGCFNENFHLSDECADAKCQPEKDDLIGNGTLGVRTSTSITVQQYLKYHGPKSICVFGKIYKVQEILHTSIYVSGISIPISISGLIAKVSIQTFKVN